MRNERQDRRYPYSEAEEQMSNPTVWNERQDRRYPYSEAEEQMSGSTVENPFIEKKGELTCAAVEPLCKRDAKYVCHHCGKPLCSSVFCAWIIKEHDPNNTFAEPSDAVHCLDCLQKYHKKQIKRDSVIKHRIRQLKLLRKGKKIQILGRKEW